MQTQALDDDTDPPEPHLKRSYDLPGARELVENASDRMALAIWQAFFAGKLIAWGGRAGDGPHGEFVGLLGVQRVENIPLDEVWDHTFVWTDRSLCLPISESSSRMRSWLGVEIPGGQDLPSADEVDADITLPLTFGDAIAITQRWRERSVIPESYVWPEEEFWHVNPEARPSRAETENAFRAAIANEELTCGLMQTKFSLDSGHGCVPGSAWIAREGERIDWLRGRINEGCAVSDAAHYAAMVDPRWPESVAFYEKLAPRWRLVVVGFYHLRRWAIERFDLRLMPHEVSPSEDAAASRRHTIAQEVRAKERLRYLVQEEPGRAKSYYSDRLRLEFGSLPKVAFKRVWTAVAMEPGFEHMSRSGRKPVRQID